MTFHENGVVELKTLISFEAAQSHLLSQICHTKKTEFGRDEIRSFMPPPHRLHPLALLSGRLKPCWPRGATILLGNKLGISMRELCETAVSGAHSCLRRRNRKSFPCSRK